MVDHSLSRSIIPEYGFHCGITFILEHGKKKAQLVNTLFLGVHQSYRLSSFKDFEIPHSSNRLNLQHLCWCRARQWKPISLPPLPQSAMITDPWGIFSILCHVLSIEFGLGFIEAAINFCPHYWEQLGCSLNMMLRLLLRKRSFWDSCRGNPERYGKWVSVGRDTRTFLPDPKDALLFLACPHAQIEG